MRRNLNQTQFDQPDALPSRGSRVRSALSRAVPSKSFLTELATAGAGISSLPIVLATTERGAGFASLGFAAGMGGPIIGAAAGLLASERFGDENDGNFVKSANKRYGTNVPGHKAPSTLFGNLEKERAKYEAIDAKLNARRGAQPKK